MTDLVSDRIPTRTRTERAPEIKSRLNLKKKNSIYLRKSTFLVAITTFAEPSVAMWHHSMLVISYLVFVLALGSQEPKALFPSWPWRHVKRFPGKSLWNVCQGCFFFWFVFWNAAEFFPIFLSFLYPSTLSSHQPPTLAATSTWSSRPPLPFPLPGARRGVTCFVLCAGHWLAARRSLCQ